METPDAHWTEYDTDELLADRERLAKNYWVTHATMWR